MVDGGGFQREEKAEAEKLAAGGWGWFQGWQVWRPWGNSLAGGQLRPGKKLDPTARWCGAVPQGGGPGGGGSRKLGKARRRAGALSAKLWGNRRRDLCRGAEPGP